MKSEHERHDRLMRQIPVLRAGFRPFFLGAASWALVVVSLWVLAFLGHITIPSRFDALAWHRHEMLFGYLAAAIAGFLLTAIPNWTGRLPVFGGGLAGLALLWLAARLAVLFSAAIGLVPAAALDVGFLAAMAWVAGREIVAARNRNYAVVAALALLALADALDYGECAGLGVAAGLGWRLGLALVLLLVALVGGRIIPSFTRNWLTRQGVRERLPAQPGRLDHATVGATVLALGAWTFVPGGTGTAALLVVAGGLQAVRLTRWSGLQTWREPLVLILHLSYAWLPFGLVALGASRFVWCIPPSAAVHALAAGAAASMTLAVMSRATLGHTGRALHAAFPTRASYACVTFGAMVRFAAPALPVDYGHAIAVAGVLWGGGFALFLAAHAGMLLGARPDGRP